MRAQDEVGGGVLKRGLAERHIELLGDHFRGAREQLHQPACIGGAARSGVELALLTGDGKRQRIFDLYLLG